MTIEFEAVRDIAALLWHRAETDGAAIALETPEASSVSYDELLNRAERIASDIHGIKPADAVRPRVGLVHRNGMDMAVDLLGICLAGTALPFNSAYTKAEFAAYFRETEIDLLLVGTSRNEQAIAAAESLSIPVATLLPDGRGIEGASPTGFSPPKPDDLALVLLTSGSTGRAKAVPLTHRNVCKSAGDVCRSVELGPGDRCLSMWEQYHVGGLVDLLLAPLLSGGTIISTGGFDAAEFFSLLENHKPTWFQGVPTTLGELVYIAKRSHADYGSSSLRFIRSVAAALQPRLMADLEDVFGVPVIQTFGMTEAGPLITSTHLPPALRKPGSTGKSCGTEIRIVGADGKECAAGAQGSIAIRGENVFAGYENDPEANAAQFDDGWFLTGDLGYLDADGDLFLTGRTKQLINRGGEKVNPQEVDDALATVPAVAEAACFVVPHPTLGEDIAAGIVLCAGETATGEDIRSVLLETLAPFKVPHRFLFVDQLPRNPVGKIDRLALSAAAEAIAPSAESTEPPRTPLEQYLAGLWRQELGVETVGIDDDFVALGGDSLSSLRIMMALEGRFDIDIMGEPAAAATTVRTMAAELTKLGCEIEPGR